MVAPRTSSPKGPVPNVYEVQTGFQDLIKSGDKLQLAQLTAAQEHLSDVVREHTQTLLYMETHGHPDGEVDDGTEQAPWCVLSFRAVYDNACASVQGSIVALSAPQLGAREADTQLTIHFLEAVDVLLQALGWVLEPASPTLNTADTMSNLQHRLHEVSAEAIKSVSSDALTSDDNKERAGKVDDWLTLAHVALFDLSSFASKTYPNGAWFANRNRRAAVRSRCTPYPTDIDETPFKALVLASRSVEDDDVTLLSEALLRGAQAHTQCLAAVRSTEERPTDPAALAQLFAPLNNAINDLSSTCEDVISRREDDRPHAHAVLEAGNIFTWLTTTQEPCVVVEEACGSANTYLGKIIARGKVLLLQQDMGAAADRPDLTKATVTWASMLRDVLQRVMLMVVYRYPRRVPWGEMMEASMARKKPQPPSEPRNGSREGSQHHHQPLWRRGASVAARGAPPAASSPPSSVPPPPSAAAEENTASAHAPPPAADPDATSPSCVFDADSKTWTVQYYHRPLISAGSGEEAEPLYIALPEAEVQPNHSVHLHHCFHAYVVVPQKVRGVTVEQCEHTRLQLAGVTGPVRLRESVKQGLLIQESAPSVYATRVRGLTIYLAGSHATEIITRLTTDVNVNVSVETAEGDQDTQELALPAQFITIIGDADTLRTKEVTYSG
ncbi:hypothetical protein ABB37_06400 [Leptomonas pyrrhocoris]|uniref:C-CAP/cofactor C-like domain-containing protein n=1 Tax=Leptomonas pyrrhocoris TaxID=157538 RepID=A0A0M9FY36_LEPPY|nr:hypothetical protein ABB37_06400 [Leptomonas pyrrhocoris]XP_015656686.1 hypothetical protein ABB37_06400 [Leptomonas pyrrhocoris]KPA78246.1 hypothetical protein ABB37_06400 [Leptomonas pyrrhocoris]KPA78247.1 hypothetical protein ABB37_06400 [Leptomonas pyrrhocoris]|eukprot:XP_015656685.1 hypothetical protein ABB37_06400 [Leptomonas pyrrhocoris]